ncbi:MAG TPA: protein kinase [Blastocatellia bacterium]|nr:protein kinase [Blastocatellia bacterium]
MSGRRIGNYLITEYIGGGGFGSVFKAEDTTQPGRIVAIKELHKKHTRNSVIKQRFFQEAVAMARLDHPNLPRLYTFGEDNGCYYLVMEFISGRVLSDELHQNGPMPAEPATAILAQVLEAVSYAHRNGIIHRDLKPDNIILIDEGGMLRVKVLDFGIARLVGGENLTLAGEGFGTPAYMSPERMWGNTSDDPRIDIYAIGIILFEMLTGSPPFQSVATDPVVYWSEMRALHESTALPALAVPGIPAELEHIIARATAKRAEDRYASVDEMLDELKRGNSKSLNAQMAATMLAPSATARLMLTTVPGGADVYVDEARQGTSDAIRGRIVIEQLAPGLRSVRVSKAGYSDYKISVALEAGQQTDLQVALAARATAMMPPAEVTAAASFGTDKFASADTSKTAMLVLESLPAGSTVFLGSEVIAAAGQDGRATLQLPPGAHAVRVTDPNGASAITVIHVNEADTGSLRTVAMPVESPARPTARPALPTNNVMASASTPLASVQAPAAASLVAGATSAAGPARAAAPVAVRPEPSPQGRRIAYAAAAVLLIVLAVGAFMVFRRPSPGQAPPDTPPAPQGAIPPPAAPDAATPPASPDAAKGTDAERAALEKKRAEAERKQKEEQQKPAKDESAPPAAAPATPTPPQQTEAEPPATQGMTCIGVWVTGPAGEMAPADLRVVVIEEPDTAAAAMYNGRTNEKGRLRKCGLTAGHRVRVAVFGLRGAMLGTKMQTLNAGLNIMQIQIDRVPAATSQSDAGNAMPFPRKRPRWQRP